MKLTLLVVAILTILTQNLFSQTSEEEYNYITKGYKVQLESGLDMKKGYEIEKLDDAKGGERSVELYKLNRVVAGKKIIAAYMIIYQKGNSSKEFLCFPNPKSPEAILNKYWEALYSESIGDSSLRLKLISYILARNLKW